MLCISLSERLSSAENTQYSTLQSQLTLPDKGLDLQLSYLQKSVGEASREQLIGVSLLSMHLLSYLQAYFVAICAST